MTLGIGNDLSRDLLGNISSEQSAKQPVLRINVVVESLNSEKRLDPGEELFAIKRFAQKVVGACLYAADPVGHVAQGRQDYDRQETGGLIGADALADLVA